MRRKSPPRNKRPEVSFTLSIRIQPRASKNEVIRMENGGLKVRLTAPPVDGAANEALVRYLSDLLHVAKSQIEIVSGHTSREKSVKISGMSDEQIRRLLNITNE